MHATGECAQRGHSRRGTFLAIAILVAAVASCSDADAHDTGADAGDIERPPTPSCDQENLPGFGANSDLEGLWTVDSIVTPNALLAVGERPLKLPPWEGGWVEFRNGGFLGKIVGRNDWYGCYTYTDGVLEFGETFQTLASCQCVLDEVEVAVTEAGRFEVEFAGADRMVWASDNVGLRLTREP